MGKSSKCLSHVALISEQMSFDNTWDYKETIESVSSNVNCCSVTSTMLIHEKHKNLNIVRTLYINYTFRVMIWHKNFLKEVTFKTS